MAVITLLTDFGTQDSYVGEMKGVILGINPTAVVVDISHNIRPQDIRQAAYMIHSAYPYFPDGTIHVIVVDPGVGGRRTIVGAKLGTHIFIAPNNGVLTLICADPNCEYAVSVESTQFFLKSVSHTFHGRDIFAPVSAHLSLGNDLKSLGQVVSKDTCVTLPRIGPDLSRPDMISGIIISIDKFGNLITNIDWNCIRNRFTADAVSNVTVQINQKSVTGMVRTYSDVDIQQPIALIGSHGYLELAVNHGEAQDYFNASIGDAVQVRVDHH